MADLRKTVATAQRSMENLDAAISEVQPGLHKFSTSTMPEVDLLVRDLRTMSKSLSGVAEKLDKQGAGSLVRSEEHTSELQSLMRIPHAVSCWKKKQEKQ